MIHFMWFTAKNKLPTSKRDFLDGFHRNLLVGTRKTIYFRLWIQFNITVHVWHVQNFGFKSQPWREGEKIVTLLKFWKASCLLTGRKRTICKTDICTVGGTARAFHTTDSNILLKSFIFKSTNIHDKRCTWYSKNKIPLITWQTSRVWKPQTVIWLSNSQTKLTFGLQTLIHVHGRGRWPLLPLSQIKATILKGNV